MHSLLHVEAHGGDGQKANEAKSDWMHLITKVQKRVHTLQSKGNYAEAVGKAAPKELAGLVSSFGLCEAKKSDVHLSEWITAEVADVEKALVESIAKYKVAGAQLLRERLIMAAKTLGLVSGGASNGESWKKDLTPESDFPTIVNKSAPLRTAKLAESVGKVYSTFQKERLQE